MRGILLLITIGWVLAMPAVARADGPTDTLDELSLEELMDVPVVSAAKKSERLGDTPAAVHVITADDIRRFGFVNIPEALRMVPGVNVARINGASYAVSIRGWNQRFAEKMLVMIDGRSIYTPIFSGVFWEFQGVPMENIERIEVVRGPGGAVWGANAVSGVINIITKSAARTVGGFAQAGGGTFDEVQGLFRYGTSWRGDHHLRGYLQYLGNGGANAAQDAGLRDGSRIGKVGVRGDFVLDTDEELTLQAGYTVGGVKSKDLYFTGLVPPLVGENNGENVPHSVFLHGEWTRVLEDGGLLTLKGWWDRESIDYQSVVMHTQTVDVELTHQSARGRHEIVWGAGYRLVESWFDNSFTFTFIPDEAQDWILNGFVQDRIVLSEDRLDLVAGLKIEYATLDAEPQLQPNLRMLWRPADGHTAWWSVGRASRSPNIGESRIDVTVEMYPPGAFGPGTPTSRVVYEGRGSVKSESVVAAEAGYRTNPTTWLGADVATYLAFIDGSNGIAAADPFVAFIGEDPYIRVPLRSGNRHNAESWGLEVALDLRPARSLRVRPGWTYTRSTTEFAAGEDPLRVVPLENHTPRHQVGVWTSWDIAATFGLECGWRYVGPIPSLDVEAYRGLDLRAHWQATPRLRLAVGGFGLLAAEHVEFLARDYVVSARAAIPRHWRANVSWEF